MKSIKKIIIKSNRIAMTVHSCRNDFVFLCSVRFSKRYPKVLVSTKYILSVH